MQEIALTEKQRRFLDEYLKDLNGSAAARRMGYSDSSARAVASRFMQAEAVRQGVREALRSAGADDPERVIRELKTVAFAPGSDGSGAEVKLASKLRALELLGKYLGLFDGSARSGEPTVTIVDDVAAADSVR